MQDCILDSHCHLNMEPLFSDLDGVLTRARACGVNRFMSICTNFDEADQVRQISRDHADVFYTVGIHPSYAKEHLEKYNIEEYLSKYNDASAIGEIGLDFHGEFQPLAVQEECFVRQIETAVSLKKPIVVHSRDADQDTVRVLSKYKGRLSGVIHCFSGDIVFARNVLDLGFYISFSGVLTYKKNYVLREVAKFVPEDRILVETDSPFLAPQKYRGKPCEPAFVVETAKVLQEERNTDISNLYAAINNNFNNLFII